MSRLFDLAIIGGGINGCGIARDAAGRGVSVFLCEMNDLASGTSSWSTKLVHGGLRYLEHLEFRLVREALNEREVLWRIAPHIIRPLRFVLPHHRGLRPAWMLRVGLFIYDHLGARRLLPASRSVDLTQGPLARPLMPRSFTLGFEYSDCRVDDARLVVLNARDAADRGAVIRPRTRAVEAFRDRSEWVLRIADRATGAVESIRARALINAAGPWVEQVLSQVIGKVARAKIRLVQGSHIVIPRLYDHDRAYVFQNTDGRIVFAIPYEDDYTLIGTTDRDYDGDPCDVAATDEEIAYLCSTASKYFAQPVTPEDIVWTFSGVRPLYDDGVRDAKAATRDYVIELDAEDGAAPLLSIFGGKITTYRRLAEAVLAKLSPYLEVLQGKRSWTGSKPLPGGDFDPLAFESLEEEIARDYPFTRAGLATRLTRTYGTLSRAILENAKSLDDLGRYFGATLTEAEVRYLIEREWAQSAEDILWRRTKLGLRLSADEKAALESWIKNAAGISSPKAAHER